jgi:hypothetical protein
MFATETTINVQGLAFYNDIDPNGMYVSTGITDENNVLVYYERILRDETFVLQIGYFQQGTRKVWRITPENDTTILLAVGLTQIIPSNPWHPSTIWMDTGFGIPEIMEENLSNVIRIFDKPLFKDKVVFA